MRRQFYELDKAGRAPIATEALTRIAELYRVEGEIRGRSPEDRRAVGQDRSRPLVAALEPWLTAKLGLISQKSKVTEAIRYALSRSAALSRFVDDGRVEIDNNMVERVIRPLVLTRKNALFAGSEGGAGHWAVAASLIETCKLNEVQPKAYLPTSSPASSPAIRRVVLTTCCPGHTPHSPPGPWLEGDAYAPRTH